MLNFEGSWCWSFVCWCMQTRCWLLATIGGTTVFSEDHLKIVNSIFDNLFLCGPATGLLDVLHYARRRNDLG